MSTLAIQHGLGGCSPPDHDILESWLFKKIQQLETQRADATFLSVIQEFQQLIEGDKTLLTLFQQMFKQIPNKPPYDRDPSKKPQAIFLHNFSRATSS